MREITVCYYKKKLLLPLNKSGNINLSTLKQYCPKAFGLCYNDEGGNTHGLALCLAEIIIDPQINTYDVHVLEDSAPSGNYSANKRTRIDEILAKIHGGKENDENVEQDEPIRKMQSLKSPKRLTKAGKQRKILHVGWLHRSSSEQQYQQMKKPMGGIKDLKLNSSHEYSVDEIKEMAVLHFTSEGSCKLMSECTTKLGFFDGRPIEVFKDTNGQPCGLWKYCKSKNVSSYRLNLYILTTLKMDDEDEDVKEDKARKESQQVDGTMIEDEDVKEDKARKKSQQVDCTMIENEDVKEDKARNESQQVDGTIFEDEDVKKDKARKESQQVDGTMIEDEDKVKEDKARNESQQVDCTMIEAASTDSDEKDNVRIFYHYVKESKYSGDKSIVELEKDDLYLQMLSEHDSPHLSIDEFEPLDHGYSISRIEKSGKVFLQIDIDDNFKKSFHFPSADHKVLENSHNIIHDIDEAQGSCKGQFGIGVIPNCTDSCKPIFTWMKNGQIFKQGPFLYWISLILEVPDETPTWTVTVNCQGSNDADPGQPDSNVAADQFSSDSLPSVYSIPSIIKEDLKISKILLGAAAQGKVRKGTWLGTDVAVKSVKLVGMNLKLISRELNVSNLIRHPNIIQTMAICPEPRQVHIVMELFRSNPLSDVLFDDDINEEYHLNAEKKNFIGNQICQAVSYLHCQANAIIHGDIKPDNILVNSNGIVKLCDLGLSKFTQMATALRSTVAAKTKRGTPIFMAPELFLERSDATLFSDIWALACTIIELYSEMPVWNLDDDNIQNQEIALREKLTNKMKPDLTAIPTELAGIMKTCFSHDISERPMAVDLQKVFNMLPQ